MSTFACGCPRKSPLALMPTMALCEMVIDRALSQELCSAEMRERHLASETRCPGCMARRRRFGVLAAVALGVAGWVGHLLGMVWP